MVVVGAVMPVATMTAAQAASHVLMGQITVGWSAPWTQDTTAGGKGPAYEQIWLDGPNGSVMVEVDAPAVPGQQLHDTFEAAFAAETPLQPVDQGSVGDVAYWLDLIPYAGTPVGAYMLVRQTPERTMMAVMIASVDWFGEGISSAQAGVTVDGAPLFGGADGAQMQQRLETAAGGGQVAMAPTPTPPTGLNPGTSDTPTPGSGQLTLPPLNPPPGGAAVTPTPDVAANGGTVELRTDLYEERTLPSPLTIPTNGWTVAWSGEWYTEDDTEPENFVGLWSPTARARLVVFHFDWADPSAQAFAQGEVEFLSSESPVPYTIESAVDVAPGHFHTIFARTTTGQTFYSIYDVVVHNDGTMTGTILEAWDTDVTAALASVQQAITTNGTPAMSDVTLALAPPSTARSNSAFPMFLSGRVVVWTGAWSEMYVTSTNIGLAGSSDGVPRFSAYDRYPGDPMTAAQWSQQLLETNPGWTVYKAIDLDNGQRLLVVMQSDDGTKIAFNEFEQSGPVHPEHLIVVRSDTAAEDLAFVQTNVTVGGMTPIADIKTHVPELFGGVAAPPTGGNANVTPAPGGQASGGSVPISGRAGQNVPETGPITLPQAQVEVNWSEPWMPQRASETSIRLWDPHARVVAEVWTTTFALPPQSAAQFAQSDLVASSGWTVEAAVDLVPGRRFGLTMSRDSGDAWMYQYSEVAVLDSHLLVVSVTGWQGEVTAALPAVSGSLTVDGQPALSNAGQATALPTAKAPNPAEHWLFDSGSMVAWTTQWSGVILEPSGVRLIGPDGAPQYRIWDVVGGDPKAAAEQAEGILAGAPQGATLYKAIDIVPGVRAMVVLQQPDGNGTRYHIFDIQYVDDHFQQGATNQYITATDADFAGQIETIRQNATLNSMPVFIDLQNHVPELFTPGS
jgi:hypothetical protein